MKRGLSKPRLERLRSLLDAGVERGDMPGFVALVHRHGDTHVVVGGTLAASGKEKMRRDTIFRISSLTKPVLAAAAMSMVEEGSLRLDDPVDELLPELADRRVLKCLSSPLEETVPAARSITLRDLLTFRLGIGAVMDFSSRHPIQEAMEEAGVAPGPFMPTVTPDQYMARLGKLPLIHQPGERWLYHTGSDVLGILLARAADRSLAEVLQERLFQPLAMRDTGFHVPADKLKRFAGAYGYDSAASKLVCVDDSKEGRWSQPPVFEAGSSGLVSTADDYLAFCRMMLAKGRHGRKCLLARPTVELMTTDQLLPSQKEGAELFFGDSKSWGLGLAVTVRRTDLWETPGRFGWDGGLGTSAYTDPQEGLIGILLTQRMMDSPQPSRAYTDFWTSAYQAIDD
ncbi:serine hydrolase [Reyranella sp.]|uniref:serine hydrolase domain-containing protein n=1 Tax=Reyranella sp. TaxID=1929291 RepID=UPI001225E334|nr:serine hydrolase domain-containing protein [Reyranella sp.]TAJ85934.1 MAG: class A beta-lactamase-related serine hydrolase [Reyranella sp.]